MKSNREGFTMVEVLVAVILLGVILTMLAGLTYTTARQAIAADHAMTREAVALQTLNRFATIPFANIAAAATPACKTVGTTNRQIQTCVTLTPVASATMIEVTATSLQQNLPPTIVQIVRSAPPAANPLCTGC